MYLYICVSGCRVGQLLGILVLITCLFDTTMCLDQIHLVHVVSHS